MTQGKAPPEEGDIWYRVESYRNGETINLLILEFPVKRVTPKGVWLDSSQHYDVREIFVLQEGRKKRAYASLVEAIYSFTCRKKKQLKILEAQADTVKKSLALAQSCLTNLEQGIPAVFRQRYSEFAEFEL